MLSNSNRAIVCVIRHEDIPEMGVPMCKGQSTSLG